MGQAWELLDAHQPALNRLAAKLCAQETVDGDEVATVLAETVPDDQPESRRTEGTPEPANTPAGQLEAIHWQ